MKKIALILILAMVTVLSAEAHKYKNTHFTISIQTFYNELSPYGDWVYTPDYGYVWRPYFEHPDAFRPYSSNGNWVNTSYGWTWVSDYRWGWATFHYGRWNFDNYMGWVWIPGYEWAPAWVSWGSYGDCWGWAPLGPDIYVQTSVDWYAPSPWWTFVPRRHFCSDNWNYYIYDRPVYVNNITHITNVYENNTINNYGHHSDNSWYYGPRVSDVERYSNRSVRSMEIAESQSAESVGVRNNRLNVYRPAVETKHNNARPGEYRSVEQVRRESTGITTNARVNNPGENSIRNHRSAERINDRGSTPNSSATSQTNRVEPRASSQQPRNTGSDTRHNTGAPPVTRVQTQNNQSSADREQRSVTPSGTSGSANRNSNQVSTDVRRESPSRDYSPGVNERNSSPSSSSRTEVKNNSFPHGKNTTREISDRVPVRTSENRQIPVTRDDKNTSERRESPVSINSSSSREAQNKNKPKTEKESESSSVGSSDRR
jgi:hypothetical protein